MMVDTISRFFPRPLDEARSMAALDMRDRLLLSAMDADGRRVVAKDLTEYRELPYLYRYEESYDGGAIVERNGTEHHLAVGEVITCQCPRWRWHWHGESGTGGHEGLCVLTRITKGGPRDGALLQVIHLEGDRHGVLTP